MKLTCFIASILLIVFISQHSTNGAPINDVTTFYPCLEGLELVDGKCQQIAFTTQNSETESVSLKLQNITVPNTIVTEANEKLNGLDACPKGQVRGKHGLCEDIASENQFATTFEPKQFDKTPAEHDNELLAHTTEPVEHENETFDHTIAPKEHEGKTLTYTDKPEEHEHETFDHTSEPVEHEIKTLTHTDKPEEHENELLAHTSEPVEHESEPLAHTSEPKEQDNELFDHTSEPVEHESKTLTHTDKPEEHDDEPLAHTIEPKEHDDELFDHTSEPVEHESKTLTHTDKPEEHDDEPLAHTSEPVEHEEHETFDHTSEPVEHENKPSHATGESEEGKNESSGHTSEKSNEPDLPKGCPPGTKVDEQGACLDEVDHKSTTVAINLKSLLSKDGKCPPGMGLYEKKCVYLKSEQSLEKKPTDDSDDSELNTIDKDYGQGKLVPLLPGNLCPQGSEYNSNGLCRLRTGSSTIKPLLPNIKECLAGEILIDGKCTKKGTESKFPMKSTTEFSKTNEVDSETEPIDENENKSTERTSKIHNSKSKFIES